MLKGRQTALDIERDMQLDSFDFTLLKYQPTKSSGTADKNVEKKPLVNLFEEWVLNYRNKNCETDIDYHSVKQMMKRWKNFSEADVLYKLNNESINEKTYNRRLTLLKNFFIWTTKTGQTKNNPLEDVCNRKPVKVKNESRAPFTTEEIGRILKAFKEDSFCHKSSRYKHSFYYPFIYFLFATGARNAEAVGLRVENIQFEKGLLEIREVLARSIKGTHAALRKRKETKNGKVRYLPLSEELAVILRECTKRKKANDLVFTSYTGKSIDDRMFQKRVFRTVLEGLGIQKRDLYAVRHTFGSRCIEAGLTPVMTAFLMGNNPETALRNYTHLIQLPKELPCI